jgi:diaminopimelate decarboxylase
MTTKPTHAEMNQFPVIDGELHIGGMSITRLAQEVGQTPFYAYDRKLISQRVQLLRDSFPKELHLHYAIKANPMPALVDHMAGLVDGFDVASAGEMGIALNTPMPPHKISFAGPGKRDEELRQAITAGIVINMESEGEMRRIAALSKSLDLRPKVAVRINPDFELKSSGMKMGGGPKPFGVDAERVPAMLDELGQLDLDFHGFHIFSGSQNLRHEAIIEAQQNTFDLAMQMAQHAPGPVRLLNIGGGLGIPFFPGDHRIDLAPIGEHLAKRLPAAKAALPEAEIVMELGRYLVGEAGIYVSRVIDKKESRGEIFLITDGGMHHNLAASGNLGQAVRKNYPVTIGNRVRSKEIVATNIVGPLCTPLDIIADRMELPRAEIGDLVVVYQSGAYGYSASPHQFLSHPGPVEILV